MNLPLNIDWQQILLHLFNFAILSLGLYLLLYNPIRNFMEKRAEYYSNLDKETKEKLAEAKDLELSYQERLNKIEAEIEEKKALAMEEIKKESEAILINAKKQAEKIISDAKVAAMQERSRILEDTREEVTSIAIVATEKLLAQSASGALDQFLEVVKKE